MISEVYTSMDYSDKTNTQKRKTWNKKYIKALQNKKHCFNKNQDQIECTKGIILSNSTIT